MKHMLQDNKIMMPIRVVKLCTLCLCSKRPILHFIQIVCTNCNTCCIFLMYSEDAAVFSSMLMITKSSAMTFTNTSALQLQIDTCLQARVGTKPFFAVSYSITLILNHERESVQRPSCFCYSQYYIKNYSTYIMDMKDEKIEI